MATASKQITGNVRVNVNTSAALYRVVVRRSGGSNDEFTVSINVRYNEYMKNQNGVGPSYRIDDADGLWFRPEEMEYLIGYYPLNTLLIPEFRSNWGEYVSGSGSFQINTPHYSQNTFTVKGDCDITVKPYSDGGGD